MFINKFKEKITMLKINKIHIRDGLNPTDDILETVRTEEQRPASLHKSLYFINWDGETEC